MINCASIKKRNYKTLVSSITVPILTHNTVYLHTYLW